MNLQLAIFMCLSRLAPSRTIKNSYIFQKNLIFIFYHHLVFIGTYGLISILLNH